MMSPCFSGRQLFNTSACSFYERLMGGKGCDLTWDSRPQREKEHATYQQTIFLVVPRADYQGNGD
jgi:hypothetical protein